LSCLPFWHKWHKQYTWFDCNCIFVIIKVRFWHNDMCHLTLSLPSLIISLLYFHNPSLGLATKARAHNSAGQKGSLGATSYIPRSAGECERMNPHTPKWTPTLGVGILMDSRIFREQLQGSKPIVLKSYLYHWKAIET